MYLAVNVKCPLGIYFDVPHKEQPMSARKIIKRYPAFAKLFDGKSVENTLGFYYKKDKETGVHGFIDLDAEEEVADLLGVKILEFDVKNEDEIEENPDRMNISQIETFKSHMSDIQEGLEWLKKSSSNGTFDLESDTDSSSSNSSTSDSE